MKDSEDKKLPDEPEIDPDMYMFFNKILRENEPEKAAPDTGDEIPDENDETVCYGADASQIFSKVDKGVKSVLSSVTNLQERYQRDKADTDKKIAELIKLVSLMMSLMKIYAGVRA